ncbi:hypothetical protein BS1321_07960 [Peribacillus simplex NBRC 15720 = DSM 1321]|uniref:Uncharacterized protein n=1 Tax=Peribacillus simplex NBRC 15720 = DSM 1321 TaxID=1349754 RepID=A0A223EF84_9BACI|nr:hypothetical protein BS1321_07960 [Peribacillus simplex NBRC 15720 = DSM 1321]CAH0239778.1 hypothetical protein SRABI84_02851 [Peribacillus simplex]
MPHDKMVLKGKVDVDVYTALYFISIILFFLLLLGSRVTYKTNQQDSIQIEQKLDSKRIKIYDNMTYVKPGYSTKNHEYIKDDKGSRLLDV